MLMHLISLIHRHWQTAFKKYQKHYTVIETESEECDEQRDSTFWECCLLEGSTQLRAMPLQRWRRSPWS